MFLCGLWHFLAALGRSAALAPSVEVAGRRARRPGRRRGAARADLAGAAAARVPAEQRAHAIGIWAATGGVAAAAGPPLGGVLVELSWRLGLPRQPADRAAPRSRPAAAAREPRPEPGPLPTCSARPARRRRRPAVARHRQGAGLGLGRRAHARRRSPPPRSGSPPSGRAAAHPSPVDRAGAAARALVRGLERRRPLFFSAAFAAFLLANVLFLTAVWHDSVLRAGLSLAPGPVMAATVASPPGARRPLRPAGLRTPRHRALRARLRCGGCCAPAQRPTTPARCCPA